MSKYIFRYKAKLQSHVSVLLEQPQTQAGTPWILELSFEVIYAGELQPIKVYNGTMVLVFIVAHQYSTH